MPQNKTPIAGVIGLPVSHSLSPKLHNYWLKKYGIEGEYVALPVPAEELAQTIKGLPQSGMRGINVTVPHKEMVARLIPEYGTIDDKAKAVDAVPQGASLHADEFGRL